MPVWMDSSLPSGIGGWSRPAEERTHLCRVRVLERFDGETPNMGDLSDGLDVVLASSNLGVYSPWWSGAAAVPTFEVAELIATKIRALFRRKKGRDLFNLWLAVEHAGVAASHIAACCEPYRPEGYSIDAPPASSWTDGHRPHAVPSRLWRLRPTDALRVFEPVVHVWRSGPPRTFDLSVSAERLRSYAIVLREGTRADKAHRCVTTRSAGVCARSLSSQPTKEHRSTCPGSVRVWQVVTGPRSRESSNRSWKACRSRCTTHRDRSQVRVLTPG